VPRAPASRPASARLRNPGAAECANARSRADFRVRAVRGAHAKQVYKTGDGVGRRTTKGTRTGKGTGMGKGPGNVCTRRATADDDGAPLDVGKILGEVTDTSQLGGRGEAFVAAQFALLLAVAFPVRPGGQCSPRHLAHAEPSCLESNDTLWRGEEYSPGPFKRALPARPCLPPGGDALEPVGRVGGAGLMVGPCRLTPD
jgi:hypothetical protein